MLKLQLQQSLAYYFIPLFSPPTKLNLKRKDREKSRAFAPRIDGNTEYHMNGNKIIFSFY